MPLYDFDCPDCGTFAALLSVDARNQPVNCPDCRRKARRQVSAPNLALMPGNIRQAYFRNEKSQHEPAVRTSHTCGSRCGCGTKPGVKLGRSNRAVEIPKLGKFSTAKKTQRPWMLGH